MEIKKKLIKQIISRVIKEDVNTDISEIKKRRDVAAKRNALMDIRYDAKEQIIYWGEKNIGYFDKDAKIDDIILNLKHYDVELIFSYLLKKNKKMIKYAKANGVKYIK